MTRGEKKFIIGLGLLLVFWRITEIPAVQDAFLQFIAIGEVPGLEQPLSPKAVYLVLATVFSLSLVLIFRQELLRSLRRHRSHHIPRYRNADGVSAGTEIANRSPKVSTATPAVITPSVVAPVTRTVRPSIIIRRQRFAATTIPIPKLKIGDKKLPALYVPSIPPVMPAVWRFIDLEMKLIAVAYHHVKTACRFMWNHGYRATAAFGHWLAPHIRYLDKKIEKRVRRSGVASEILEIVEECWRTLRVQLQLRKAKPTDESS